MKKLKHQENPYLIVVLLAFMAIVIVIAFVFSNSKLDKMKIAENEEKEHQFVKEVKDVKVDI